MEGGKLLAIVAAVLLVIGLAVGSTNLLIYAVGAAVLAVFLKE